MQTDLDGDSAWEIFVAVKETRCPIQCVPRIVCGELLVMFVLIFYINEVKVQSHRLPDTPWAFCERHTRISTALLLSSKADRRLSFVLIFKFFSSWNQMRLQNMVMIVFKMATCVQVSGLHSACSFTARPLSSMQNCLNSSISSVLNSNLSKERHIIEVHLRCSYFHTPSSCVSGAVRITSTS